MDNAIGVKRFISEYLNETDELLAEYHLVKFDLCKFQKEFGESDEPNPMFDCYPINQKNIAFLRAFLSIEPVWDFETRSYFVEASQ